MAIHWTENFESGLSAWTTYGLGNNFQISTTEHYNGTKALVSPYPNGGFIDRFVPTPNKQFNIKFAVKLASNFVVDSIGTKIIYVRLDQSQGQLPNGYFAMMFGNPALMFIIQGAHDRSDTENLPLNIVLSSQWKEIEFQWIFNDGGVSNGSMNCWIKNPDGSWTNTFSESGRQYRGPDANTVWINGQNNGSNNFVNNIRIYAQHGQGNIYLDDISIGNTIIGDATPPPEPEPPPALLDPPTGLLPAVEQSQPPGNVTLSWNPVLGASGYRVRIHKVGTPYDPIENLVYAADQVETFKSFIAEAGATYDWWVHTLNSQNEAGLSNGSLLTILAEPNPEPQPEPEPEATPQTILIKLTVGGGGSITNAQLYNLLS